MDAGEETLVLEGEILLPGTLFHQCELRDETLLRELLMAQQTRLGPDALEAEDGIVKTTRFEEFGSKLQRQRLECHHLRDFGHSRIGLAH